MRRRIWVELLPIDELARPETRALLARHRVEPIVALPPSRQTDGMHRALSGLAADGVPIGLWPLLDDADGYWLSTENGPAYLARVEAALAWAAELPIRTVAFDLEPPLPIMRALSEGRVALPLARAVAASLVPDVRRARAHVRDALAALTASLRQRGIESIAAILPPLVLDLDARHRPIQAVLSTPLDPGACDVACPMMYSTLIAPLFPAGGSWLARELIERAARRLVARRGAARTSIALGLVGPGKLENEPIYGSPRELGADVQAALRGGATDLALFSLEGVLGRDRPEAWLAELTGRP